MSEEILKALMQLFAIIAKQDEGVSVSERDFVHTFLKERLEEGVVDEYLQLFDDYIEKENKKKKKKKPRKESEDKEKDEKKEKEKSNMTSVKDSVRTLSICKKINKTLTQKQKVIVLVHLFEIVNADRKFSDQRMAIIDAAANVFNISSEEHKSIEKFIISTDFKEISSPNVLIISDSNEEISSKCKSIVSEGLSGAIIILNIPSANLYFLKFSGETETQLNGQIINNKRIYLFANGSILKPSIGKSVFYSDVIARFLADKDFVNLSFEVNNVEFRFPNGNIGLRDINISEGSGKLIGIMGASGAGKTTMLNVLSGIESPSDGDVLINSINLHTENDKIKGIIGYIPQDDLLIEELTVYQNLYYNAKLCFKSKSEEEIDKLVISTLSSLGLLERKDLQVGNPLDKKISGGQRKRLNIALELIREPAVLFVDEPTSGLSSKDSENVMGLLRELALKGKLIFVVIHQPSSDIYKLFDNIMYLDTGGYLTYYGNPIEAIMYFKKLDNQINSDSGDCPSCGNVNPELVFNIIEAKVVDEYGNSTNKRKTEPTSWAKYYTEHIKTASNKIYDEVPPNLLRIPSKLKQFGIFFTRDILSKLANRQYMTISLLEAPLLGFLLSIIIRYTSDPEKGTYIFRENDNIFPYIFMSIIVVLFIGLTVSAEEIFKDRKILKREQFLNLSKSSYFLSKISILFILSAVQSILFLLIGNSILEIKGMYFEYWLVLFSISCSANLMGLNISSAFNSAVTIYILIPLLIIPQMMLCGAMFNYEKLNSAIGGGKETPPILAEIMPSRWGFEALVVKQFKDNKYEKEFFELDKFINAFDYKTAYYIPELKSYIEEYESNFWRAKLRGNSTDSLMSTDDLMLLRNEIAHELQYEKSSKSVAFLYLDSLKPGSFSVDIAEKTMNYLNSINSYYNEVFNAFYNAKDEKIRALQKTPEDEIKYKEYFNKYYNDNLAEILQNTLTKKKIVRENNRLIQKINPIFLDPQQNSSINFRTHFYAPNKKIGNILIDTYYLNIIVIWLFTVLLYITLYYNSLKRAMALGLKLNEKLSESTNSFILSIKEKIEKRKKMKKPKKKKKKKEKKVPVILILLAPLLFVISCTCSDEHKNSQEEISELEDSILNQQINLEKNTEQITNIVQNMASPVELANLIKSTGAKFSDSYLATTENTEAINNSHYQALFLGIYGADLGYINIYEKNSSVFSYLSAIRVLSDKLHVGQFFDFATLKRLASNSSNIDSLTYISVDNFNRMESFLRESNRSHISTLILCGMWLESLHIAGQVYETTNNSKLAERIGEQKIILNDLLTLIAPYKKHPRFNKLIMDFDSLHKLYDKVNITIEYHEPEKIEKDGVLIVKQNETSIVDVSAEQLNLIINDIGKIRNNIIQQH